ncbi:serpentine type 7TM GPCR receptor class ab chemoreceptor domain-containing protein [Ditylenchus destructor]|uniref:Serpentine type 7TM GPCR receptor class ab chemoreceptor domain-containing protein n=1 Tax=Ditylenchus destructor TaxID=166010 RepID=A0AAD4MNW5_9BILA|nr:serpentine type 7TM GPCR receptor class ab chemoreceptor domain-containing protein [Ditylenchus destructor]
MFHVTTILFTFHVVYCSKFGNKSTKLDRISNSFFIFLISRGLGAVLAAPYQVYMLIYWSPEVHNCQTILCVALKHHMLVPTYVKFGIGGLNILGSCYLIRAMKWNNEKLKNDVVKLTITMDIFLDVIPTFASFIFITYYYYSYDNSFQSSLYMNLSKDSTAPMVFYVSKRSFIIYIIELSILTTGLLYCSLFLVVLLKIRCFHRNLRLLLINFTVSYMIEIVSRQMILIPLIHTYLNDFHSPLDTVSGCRVAHILHDMAIAGMTLDVVVLVIERSIATVGSKTYEQGGVRTCSSPLLSITLIAAQWALSFVLVWIYQIYNTTDENKVAYVIAAACQKVYFNKTVYRLMHVLSIIMDAVAITVFIILLRINRRRYEEKMEQYEKGSAYLSERYQTVENIRSTRLLYPLMIARQAVVQGMILIKYKDAHLHNVVQCSQKSVFIICTDIVLPVIKPFCMVCNSSLFVIIGKERSHTISLKRNC